MKNLNDLLAWSDTAQHFFSERLCFNPSDKILRDLKINVSFQKGEAHLPKSINNVCFTDCAMPAQIFENILKLVAELRKHTEFELTGSVCDPAITSSVAEASKRQEKQP